MDVLLELVLSLLGEFLLGVCHAVLEGVWSWRRPVGPAVVVGFGIGVAALLFGALAAYALWK